MRVKYLRYTIFFVSNEELCVNFLQTKNYSWAFLLLLSKALKLFMSFNNYFANLHDVFEIYLGNSFYNITLQNDTIKKKKVMCRDIL